MNAAGPSAEPADPAGVLRGLAPRLYEIVGDAVAALRSDGAAELPDAGAQTPALVRATWRWWLAGRPWAPLRYGAPDPARPDALVVAASPAPRALGPADRAATSDAGADGPTLRVSPTRAVALDTVESEVLARLDATHAAAADPSLARARALLLSQARAGDVVYVQGPLGSGRASLAAWAAEVAVLLAASERALDRGAPPPLGALPPRRAATVLRDLDEASAENRAACAEALRRREHEPARPGGAPPARRPTHPAFDSLVGRDPALCRVLDEVVRHAPGRHPVLILGETGTGKEALARAVHTLSGRKGPLVKLDLAARPDTLQDDDLFGHVPGAFADARTRRLGAAREADKGTLFLDEIGNLPLAAQARLLGLLEDGVVRPLGSDEVHHVDVRVVAATNADLHAMVAAGTFRADLLYRIEAAVVRAPPLRERPDDVLRIARHLLAGLPGHPRLTPAAEAALVRWPWPGNVRELGRLLGSAAALAGGVIDVEHLGEPGLSPPLLVTGQVDPERIGAPLTRRQAQILGAVRVVLPPPAERGRDCLLHAVLAALGETPIDPDALELLLAAPWWGNLVELHRRTRLLTAAGGPVTAALVREALPELAKVGGRVPIVTMVSPTLKRGGRVGGLSDEHHEGALVIGRAESSRDLALHRHDAAAAARRDWFAEALGGVVPGFAPVRNLMALSRAHVLITRTAAGLEARTIPGASLPAVGGPLGEAPAPLRSDRPTPLGPAGVVTIEGDGHVVHEVFVFLGPEARAAAEPLLAARCRGDADATLRGPREQRRVHALDATARALLTTIVVECVATRGELAPLLRRRLGEITGPAATELRTLLLGGKPSQATTRLYRYPANDALRAELVAALRAAGLWESAATALPIGVWEVLSQEGASE